MITLHTMNVAIPVLYHDYTTHHECSYSCGLKSSRNLNRSEILENLTFVDASSQNITIIVKRCCLYYTVNVNIKVT